MKIVRQVGTIQAAILLRPEQGGDRMRLLWLLVCAALLVAAVSVEADVVRFQQGMPNALAPQGYSGASDTYIYLTWENYHYGSYTESNLSCGDYNYGISDLLGVGERRWGTSSTLGSSWDYGRIGVGLLKFNLSALVGKQIVSARLYCYLQEDPNTVTDPFHVPWVLGVRPVPQADADWVAGTHLCSPEPGSACYDLKCGTNPWSTTSQWGLDSKQGWSILQQTWLRLGNCQEAYIDLSPAMVQSWVSSPATNGGLLLFGWDNTGTATNQDCPINYLVSCDSPDRRYRPVLEIGFVPEPGSLAVLAAGLFALPLIKRRKRVY